MSVRFVRKGQKLGHHQMGHVSASAVFGGDAALTGAMILSGYVETDQVVVSGFSDKGAGVPASGITMNKTATGNVNEWGYVVATNTSKDIAWLRMFEGVNGIAAAQDRVIISGMAYRPGDTHAYFTWYTQADNVQTRDETDTVIETWNRPPNSGPATYTVWWGGVTAVDIATGAFAWTSIADWDTAINSNNVFDLRPFQIAWGGPDNDDLVVGLRMGTQKATAPIPKPVFGTTVQAVYPNIDFARVGNSAVTGTWLVKINTANGDAASTSAHVANFNDDIASAGTPYRGFAGSDRFNTWNFLWNPVTELWYLSANHSGYASLNVFGTIVGNSRAGAIHTRGTDNFGGNNSVKPYLCTYDANFDPQNVVTMTCTVLNNGNNRYAYQHAVALVPDGSGDVLWGWQNMTASPAIDMQREGVLGNYGAPYIPADQNANNSIIMRLDNDLEVTWEASAFSSAHLGLGRGHSVVMVPFPDEPSRMLAMISTQNVNTVNTSATLFGAGPYTFDIMQTMTVNFDITTGIATNRRLIQRPVLNAKMVAIWPSQADSGPDTGKTFALVHSSKSANVSSQGFYDTSTVRVYNPADYWNSNTAVYTTAGDAVHIVCYGADGEPDANLCWPLMATAQGGTASNSWAIRAIPL